MNSSPCLSLSGYKTRNEDWMQISSAGKEKGTGGEREKGGRGQTEYKEEKKKWKNKKKK